MAKPEFLVQAIYAPQVEINLQEWLEYANWSIRDKLSSVQIRFSGSAVTREHLGQLANRVFSIRPLRPEEISENLQDPAEVDSAFASEFGFTLIPKFACLQEIAAGKFEAWINPVLLPQNHPLADKVSNGVALFSNPSATFPEFYPIDIRVLPFDELELARYIRLTIDDQPSVLSEILDPLAREEINIHEFRQPELEKGSPTTQVAVILNPCSGLSLARALQAIQDLPVCRSIDTVLPVLGVERHGMVKIP